ncbi:MAG: hypothetical protein ACM3UU_03215 [Ignavibacteriales bacterium]
MEDKKILILETIAEARGYLDRLIAGIEKYVDHLTKNNIREAAVLLPGIIDGLEWTYKVLYYMAPNFKNDFELARCQDLFVEISNVMGNNDTVAICDLFTYEIIPLLQKWSKYLDEENTLLK